MRSSSLLVLANGIVLALGMVRTPLMTWIIPKDEIGMLGVVAAWMPFVQLLSLNGLDAASYHYTARGLPWSYLINLTYRLRWSLLSAALFIGGAAYWFWSGAAELGWMFVVTAASLPLVTGLSSAPGMLSAQERFKALFWYRLWESLTDFAGFIPLALSLLWVNRIVTFYAANQAATAVMMVGVTTLLARQVLGSGAPRLLPAQEKEVLDYGRHQTAIAGIGALQNRADALLVAALAPLATVADYGIALLVSEQFKRLWVIYTSVRYPPLVKLTRAARRRRFAREGGLVTGFFIAAGAGALLLGHWLIPWILPPAYTTSLPYLDILVAAYVATVPGLLAEIYFRMEGEERPQYAMRVLPGLLGLGASLALSFPLGAYGIALGRLVGGLGMSLVGVALFLRQAPGETAR